MEYKQHTIFSPLTDLFEKAACQIKYFFNPQTKLNDQLFEASRKGDLDTIKILLENGADLHAHGDYAVCCAAVFGQTKVLAFFMDLGVDIKQPDYFQNTPTHTPLIWAAGNGHTDTVKYLLKNGADIHAQNGKALHAAAQSGHTETVKFLLDNGADVHANNDMALILAINAGHLETVKFLLDNGADITALHSNAYIHPIHKSFPFASRKEQEAMIALLESYSINNPKGNSNITSSKPRHFKP